MVYQIISTDLSLSKYDIYYTHMPVVVHQIIGKLQFIKGHDLLHPLGSLGGGVGVDMDPPRHVGIRLSRHHPARAVEGVAVTFVVTGDKVHHHHVVRAGVKAV